MLASDPNGILLDSDGHLDLSSGLRFGAGGQGVAQSLRVRLAMFKGEWFLDQTAGVPYYQDLLGKKFNEIRARAAFRTVILATPGVGTLDALTVAYSGITRTLRVTWRVTCTFGDTITETTEILA